MHVKYGNNFNYYNCFSFKKSAVIVTCVLATRGTSKKGNATRLGKKNQPRESEFAQCSQVNYLYNRKIVEGNKKAWLVSIHLLEVSLYLPPQTYINQKDFRLY